MQIDLNADLGESFGRYRLEDRPLLDVVTSANIACGFHAGDPRVMRETVRAAAGRGVVIGAHPSYPDLVGFGRRDMSVSAAEVEALIIYQIGALQAFCASEGVRLRYVKPHGALYNRAARDAEIATAIAQAVRAVDATLAVMGLAGSLLVQAAEKAGLHGLNEGFVDRGYSDDGTLVPRDRLGALIEDADVAADRAVRMVQEQVVVSVSGKLIPLRVDSLCTHGDGPEALATVTTVRKRLQQAGIRIAPCCT